LALLPVPVWVDERMAEANIRPEMIAAKLHRNSNPKPTTWGIMILGFAGVGFMASRRRKGSTLAFTAASSKANREYRDRLRAVSLFEDTNLSQGDPVG
jgi:hypothetical protein